MLLNNSTSEEKKKKNIDDNKKKLLALKILFFSCLFALAKQKELGQAGEERRKVYEEYVKEMKKLNLSKFIEKAAQFNFVESELNE